MPGVQMIDTQLRDTQALVLSPTRELAVQIQQVVLQKYPLLAVAVNPVVLTDVSQSAVPSAEIVLKDNIPEPLVVNACPAEPSALGNLIPSKFNLPVPFGVSLRSIFVSSPVAAISGALPVAEFVTVISLTALAVSANLTNSNVPSPIDCPLTSNIPPSCGVVSCTKSVIPPEVTAIQAEPV